MANQKRWEKTEIINGYTEVKLLKWKYFFEFVHQEMLSDSYIWRGQRNESWPLEPSLDRLFKKAKIIIEDRVFQRVKHLNNFKLASRGRRGLIPQTLDNENEWWALGQHFGLATPLLDWTSKPFVAAYFAFIDSGSDQTSYRAVYALHKPRIEEKVSELIQQETDKREKERNKVEKEKGFNVLKRFPEIPIRKDVEFVRPMSDENQRLVNQGGLFTRFLGDGDIESWISKNFHNDIRGSYLMKIRIPNKDRNGCLKTLNSMNINHLTLFPDLSGASKFCNFSAEIKGY